MHVASGKLRKEPFTKDGCGQDGQSKMYAIELAEMTKDWQTGEKQYTNYKCLFFAKTDGAKSFYDKAFAQDSFVVVACEKLLVESRDHNGTTYISLVMDNPRLESCMPVSDQQSAPQQQQQYQQPAQQQQTKQAGAPQYNEPPMAFDDDIPFN